MNRPIAVPLFELAIKLLQHFIYIQPITAVRRRHKTFHFAAL